MQAIQTRYLGPTNYRSSRIKAFAAAGSVTVTYDHGLNLDENHAAAAYALREKLDWANKHYPSMTQGVLPCGDHVHVFRADYCDLDTIMRHVADRQASAS